MALIQTALLETTASVAVPNSQTVRAGLASLGAAAITAMLAAGFVTSYHGGRTGKAVGAAISLCLVVATAIAVFRGLTNQNGPGKRPDARGFAASSAWLAPFAVLVVEGSWLLLPASAVLAVLVARALRAPGPASHGLPHWETASDRELFLPTQRSQAAAGQSAWMKIAAIAAYLGVLSALTGGTVFAVFSIGLSSALVAWFWMTPARQGLLKINATIGVAFALLLWVTVPPVWATSLSSTWRLDRDEPAHRADSALRGLHSSVVLLAEAQLESRLDAPPGHDLVQPRRQRRTTFQSIPFTGEYWYFYWPLKRPGPDATRKFGNPMFVSYNSVDNSAFIMQARQPLHRPLSLSCCRAVEVVLDSQERQPQTVSLELMLVDSSGDEERRQSLGSRALGPATDGQGLRFEVMPDPDIQSFNELMARFHLDESRRDRSAKVAIKRFDLVP